jgi:predicted aspartyl protease
MSNRLRQSTRLLLLLLLCHSCRPHTPTATEQHCQSLLKQKDFFRLRTLLATASEDISPEKRRYYQAYTDNAFNRNQASDSAISQLLDGSRNLNDSLKANLLLLKEDNDFKLGRYALAAEANKLLLASFWTQLDSSDLDDARNKALIENGLIGIPPQQTVFPADTGTTIIPWERDLLGLIEIPVYMGDTSVSSIFDTRANISSIMESDAKRLGIRMLGVKYKEGSGATGNTFQVALGVADSLRFGNILVRNVVFQVMPDSILYIGPPVDVHLHLILGYPVIAQLREVHILRNGSLVIPATPTRSTLQNLAMSGLDPVLRCSINQDTLIFAFDTGASSSAFNDNYFHRFEKEIVRDGQADSVSSAGAGGSIRQKVTILKEVHLNIGSQTAILKKITVNNDPLPNTKELIFGNLGQDLMQLFGETILNFDSMYIEFK